MIMKLIEVLRQCEEYDWRYSLFVSMDTNLQFGTDSAVLDPNDIEDDTLDEPPFAIVNNLKYLIGVADLQDIVDNLKQQTESITDELLMEAFMFYINNDAYIRLTE